MPVIGNLGFGASKYYEEPNFGGGFMCWLAKRSSKGAMATNLVRLLVKKIQDPEHFLHLELPQPPNPKP